MKKTNFVLMCGGLFMLSAVYVTVGAQVPAVRSANDGVYTAEQAKRGDALYKEQCATCHGDNLEGSGPMPPLAGKDFLTNWTGKSVGDLFEKTHTTMPATAPGTLTPVQAADIVAYLLNVGQYPAGTTELDSKIESLLAIKIDPPKEAVGARAPAAQSANDGVYTVEQAKRGDALYKEQCATCHGDNLEGSGPMPPLAGKDFLTNWSGKSVGDLFEKTHTTMPATAPGTLTPVQAADIVAHLLNVGRYPAGTTELDSKIESLLAIKIDPPKEAAAAPADPATAPSSPAAPAPPASPPPPANPAPPASPAPPATPQ